MLTRCLHIFRVTSVSAWRIWRGLFKKCPLRLPWHTCIEVSLGSEWSSFVVHSTRNSPNFGNMLGIGILAPDVGYLGELWVRVFHVARQMDLRSKGMNFCSRWVRTLILMNYGHSKLSSQVLENFPVFLPNGFHLASVQFWRYEMC